MRLKILTMLCMAILVLPMIASTAGAIYLEGQAPPDGTSPHILAASSGLTGSNGPATAIQEELPKDDAIVLFYARFPYTDAEAIELPKVPVLSAGADPLPVSHIENLPRITSARYWEMPGFRTVGM